MKKKTVIMLETTIDTYIVLHTTLPTPWWYARQKLEQRKHPLNKAPNTLTYIRQQQHTTHSCHPRTKVNRFTARTCRKPRGPCRAAARSSLERYVQHEPRLLPRSTGVSALCEGLQAPGLAEYGEVGTTGCFTSRLISCVYRHGRGGK